MIKNLKKTVALSFMNEPEDPFRIAMKLAANQMKVAIRLTGGCGSLTPQAAEGMCEVLADAFYGYKGIWLYGGTRMVRRDNENIVVPGITEVASFIRRQNSRATVLGVIPRTDELRLRGDGAMIVADEHGKDYLTIVHPDQDICLVVQANVNKGFRDEEDEPGSKWLAEANVCIKITSLLLEVSGWRSLLLSYSGGNVTQQEIVKTARLGWPVLLVEGGGGSTDALAADRDFRKAYPLVRSAPLEVAAIRSGLKQMTILPKSASNAFAKKTRSQFKLV